jgi:DNA-binding PadR family transcriptional regulator
MPRMTSTTRRVLAALIREPGQEHYGLELAPATGLSSGTLYPILARLEEAGLVTSRWEDVDQSAAGRPRRRYYRLSASGLRVARGIEQDERSLARLILGQA